MIITKDEAAVKMETSNGKIFTAHFVKKDGSARKMNCRTGVSKYVTGVGLKFDPKSKGLLGVFDLQSKGYRFISLDKVFKLTISGETHEVVA